MGWRVIAEPREGRLGSGLAVSRCVKYYLMLGRGMLGGVSVTKAGRPSWSRRKETLGAAWWSAGGLTDR